LFLSHDNSDCSQTSTISAFTGAGGIAMGDNRRPLARPTQSAGLAESQGMAPDVEVFHGGAASEPESGLARNGGSGIADDPGLRGLWDVFNGDDRSSRWGAGDGGVLAQRDRGDLAVAADALPVGGAEGYS
jgi:hypothetical protein